MSTLIVLAGLQSAIMAAEPVRLGPGDTVRELNIDGSTRSYLVHVPPICKPADRAPVVLAFHGAGMNAALMPYFSGLSSKADQAGFVVVYPNGTGLGPFLTFNSGGVDWSLVKKQPDDVAFVARVLDDLATVVPVDPRRIYATGISNGGMMCYRLAAEMSDRIAAIAPVAGTMAPGQTKPHRPVPVLHFHGTEDGLVPYDGPDPRFSKLLTFESVERTIATWVAWNGCRTKPLREDLPDAVDDGTTVTREIYRADQGADVILISIHGGGHTWPGRDTSKPILGRVTRDICATDLIWDFFRAHRLQCDSAPPGSTGDE